MTLFIESLVFFQHPHSTIALYERDDCVEYPDGHPLSGTRARVRGKFPDVSTFKCTRRQMIKGVSGAFRNTTTLIVPPAVSTFLSLGPKFMLPAFTLMHPVDKLNTWDEMLDQLTRAEYPCMRLSAVNHSLRSDFDAHCGDSYFVSAMDRHILKLASITSTFLHQHRKEAALVEGDKGKIMGLLPRPMFQQLCDEFIADGVSEGRYVLSTLGTEEEVLAMLVRKYNFAVAPLLVNPAENGFLRLFMPAYQLTPVRSYDIIRMNSYVRHQLSRINWKIPIFRPSIKYHKFPLKLRPIVSKRDTPSIPVGRVILFALKKIM